jgi:nucleotide-binding universal stress UspA family protein
MKPIQHILVATDFGESSKAAVETGVFMAKKLGAILTLFHAYEIPIYGMDGVYPAAVDFLTPIREDAEKTLATTLAEVRKSMPDARSVLCFGSPWQGILNTVEELHVDLVVMGTHGRRGVAHALLGSVAEKTVRLSPVPVLTVPVERTTAAQPATKTSAVTA